MAYLLGMLGNLLPLPGGVGGVEGGMVGACAAFGMDAGIALVAVLAILFLQYSNDGVIDMSRQTSRLRRSIAAAEGLKSAIASSSLPVYEAALLESHGGESCWIEASTIVDQAVNRVGENLPDDPAGKAFLTGMGTALARLRVAQELILRGSARADLDEIRSVKGLGVR